MGIDISKYSLHKKYHDTILDSRVSSEGLESENIRAAFINDQELNFLQSDIKENIFSTTFSRILPESQFKAVNYSSELREVIEVNGSNINASEVEGLVYSIDRNTRMNVVLTEILQEYKDFELDEDIQIDSFALTFKTETKLHILEICDKMEIYDDLLFCLQPQYLIDNGNQLFPFNSAHLKEVKKGSGMMYNPSCSRPFSMYTKVMQICEIEGDRYLEITDYRSLKRSEILLLELTDGNARDYVINTYMVNNFTFFSAKIYIKGVVESVAVYSMDHVDEVDTEKVKCNFIGKDSLTTETILWTITHTYSGNILASELSFSRIDNYLSFNQINTIVSNMKFNYDNRFYEITSRQRYPEYDYSYSTDIDFDKFITADSKMINFKRDIKSNMQDSNLILNFNPLGDSFLIFWSKLAHNVNGFKRGRRIRFSNPFIGLQTKSNPDPICKKWLCVFCHVYPTTSYFSLYYFDSVEIDKLDVSFPYRNDTSEGRPSPHYNIQGRLEEKIEVLDSLRHNYTIYTFRVINETGIEIEQLFWDPKEVASTSALSFYAVGSGNITKRYTVGPTSFIKSLNSYIDLNGKEIDLMMRGTMGKNISKRIRLVKFNINESITKKLLGLLALVCSAMLVVMVLRQCLVLEGKASSQIQNTENK